LPWQNEEASHAFRKDFVGTSGESFTYSHILKDENVLRQ
jgi:hypothetical protein